MSVQLPGTNTVLQWNLIHHSQISEELGEGAVSLLPRVSVNPQAFVWTLFSGTGCSTCFLCRRPAFDPQQGLAPKSNPVLQSLPGLQDMVFSCSLNLVYHKISSSVVTLVSFHLLDSYACFKPLFTHLQEVFQNLWLAIFYCLWILDVALNDV